MVRFKQVEEIAKLMKDIKRVRNIGTLAHVDHGKTTLSDNLLMAAGLISPKVAAKALALDYVPIEQMRQMTVKAANISLYHVYKGEPYIINLVDTPGHIDFTGHVTRSLRVMDGAVVVVDAVEGVMTQTETVVRQGLEEGVRPLLFINKVDRLVRELRLSPGGVQERLLEIIRDFNGLIDLYADPEFRDVWKVDVGKGQVAFGSALHKWGVTVPLARELGFKFSDVVDAYRRGGDAVEELAEAYPLHRAILEMVIEHVPNPAVAQRYRLRRIWGGDLKGEVGRAMLECDAGGPLVFAVSKVVDDPHAGLVATGRVFSGTVRSGEEVYLVRAGRVERVQQVGLYMGPYREVIGEVPAGNIAAVLGLEFARAGETVVDVKVRDVVVPFEALHYVSEPVVTVAIEPKRSGDLPRLVEALRRLAIEDPTLRVKIDQETGEYLVSGMGSLHLEIVLWDLRRRTGIEFETSAPLVVYRESVRGVGEVFEVKSPNKHNRVVVNVEPLNEETLSLLSEGRVTEDMEWRARAKVLREYAGWDSDEARSIWAIDDHFNIFVDLTKGVQYLREVRDTLINGFRWTTEAGPLAGEPMRGVKVKLLDAEIHEDPAHRGPAQLMPALKNATMASFLTARPVLLEPVYKIDVKVVPEFLSEAIGVITMRRGRILMMEQRGRIAVVRGEIPVSETHDLSDAMRSATQGRAFWATEFSRWAPVPESLALDIIMKIRERKGLPKRLPAIEDYVKLR